MSSYITDNNISDVAVINNSQSYLPSESVCKTEQGEPEEEVVALAGDDDIFSKLNLNKDIGSMYPRILQFIADFTRVFVDTKTPNRAYSKFVQNKDELPDVELDWVFQYFSASFLFSVSGDDYYCITKYDVKANKYDSTTGPLKKENYRAVAEEVMQNVL